MTDDVEVFVREGRELLVDLNNPLLAVEDDPIDREALDVVFRSAHTLTGNFAPLGFDGAAELAHAVEDPLDGIRDGSVADRSGDRSPMAAGGFRRWAGRVGGPDGGRARRWFDRRLRRWEVRITVYGDTNGADGTPVLEAVEDEYELLGTAPERGRSRLRGLLRC